MIPVDLFMMPVCERRNRNVFRCALDSDVSERCEQAMGPSEVNA